MLELLENVLEKDKCTSVGIRTHTHTYTHTHTHTHIHKHAHTHIHTYTHTNMHFMAYIQENTKFKYTSTKSVI